METQINDFCIAIGAEIRKRRLAAKYKTAEAFAYTHDIDRGVMYSVEIGRPMHIKTLVRICDALGVTVSDLLVSVNQPQTCKPSKIIYYNGKENSDRRPRPDR